MTGGAEDRPCSSARCERRRAACSDRCCLLALCEEEHLAAAAAHLSGHLGGDARQGPCGRCNDCADAQRGIGRVRELQMSCWFGHGQTSLSTGQLVLKCPCTFVVSLSSLLQWMCHHLCMCTPLSYLSVTHNVLLLFTFTTPALPLLSLEKTRKPVVVSALASSRRQAQCSHRSFREQDDLSTSHSARFLPDQRTIKRRVGTVSVAKSA